MNKSFVHHRRSIRLKGYDYTQCGAYFVTICTWRRGILFGAVVDGAMILNENGRLVQSVWEDLPNHYTNVALDAFVVMPNHVHGIIILNNGGNDVGAGLKPAPTPAHIHGLPEIVRALKTFTARRINELHKSPGAPVWQRNYYEHIIRNEADWRRIFDYIQNNPACWQEDQLHPAALPNPFNQGKNNDL
jgi:REP element-mobilizing transposase RayT